MRENRYIQNTQRKRINVELRKSIGTRASNCQSEEGLEPGMSCEDESHNESLETEEVQFLQPKPEINLYEQYVLVKFLVVE